MSPMTDELRRLEQTIAETAHKRESPKHFAAWRQVLRYYHEVSRGRKDPEPAEGETEYKRLWELAQQAIVNLGGQCEPSLATMVDYDLHRYGPLLGVSNEGSATAAIRHGALSSPKCSVIPERTPLTVGVAHDAERLGAVGEVAVGPDEYSAIRLACAGRLLTTTNVGTRANVRSYLPPPVLKVRRGGKDAMAAASRELERCFEPYWKAPGGKPRPLTVLVRFEGGTPPRRAVQLFAELQDAVARGTFCEPKAHHLGLLVALRRGPQRLSQAKAAVDLAAECQLKSVALDGPVLPAAWDATLPGLLNLLAPAELDDLLRHAVAQGVQVAPRQRLDPATTARHAWQGLSVARSMGFELGKYGLVPLTLEEQKEVIARIQYWFKHWCAAPACFVDYPIVTAREVYHGARLAEGIRRWLEMVAKLHVCVVLIDTVKKSEGRRLLKDSPDDDRGFLTLDEVRELDARGARLGVKVLWAGGISQPQAFEYGKLGVFGVYVTSAAATLKPLDRHYRRDPSLAGVREPQPEAVARVKLLLEAGFLANRLQARGMALQASEIETAARRLIANIAGKDEEQTRNGQAELYSLVARAWKAHLNGPTHNSTRSGP
jgi:hypothetical protein